MEGLTSLTNEEVVVESKPTVPFFLCVLDYLVVTLDRLVSRYKYNGTHSIGHDRSD